MPTTTGLGLAARSATPLQLNFARSGSRPHNPLEPRELQSEWLQTVLISGPRISPFVFFMVELECPPSVGASSTSVLPDGMDESKG